MDNPLTSLYTLLWTWLLLGPLKWCLDDPSPIRALFNLVFRYYHALARKSETARHDALTYNRHESGAGFPPVEPLQDFDWQMIEPLKLRPFKPKYFLTMAVEKTNVSELIQIDRDFLSRLDLRKRIMAEHPESTLRANAASQIAINELYTFLVTTYLPTRFPSIFHTSPSSLSQLTNVISGVSYPLAPPASALATLHTLGGLVDEDFMFLLPSPDGDGHSLQAYVVCYSSGFALDRIFDAKLRDIHAEVPGYRAKLQTSMDRWFERVPVGSYVRRTNWTVTMKGQLRNAVGDNQHYGISPSPSSDSNTATPAGDIDTSDAHLRTELQHVYRLLQSRAIIFSYKTYLYPLQEIKEEGNGPALAQAIEGLGEGNVPDMKRYKGAGIWGKKVAEFLRE